MRRNGGGAACWGVFREVEHSPCREGDDAAILEATGRRLEQFGFSVAHRVPESLDAAETGVPPLVFAMCEGPSALEVLGRWERRGVRVINGTRAIVNTHRERSLRLLIEHGVPVPESRLLDGDLPVPRGVAETPLYSACWVKQASEHKTREGDVGFATDADSVQGALDRLRARGLTRAIVQRHVEGDMVKFYGVGGSDSVGGTGSSGASWFQWFYPKEHPVQGHRFDPSALRDIACRAAEALELEVWGGDAIVTPRGDIFVIDVNAWPSFSLFRDEAAGHIAAHLAARLRPLTDATERRPATLVLMKAGGRPSAAGTSLLGLPLLRRTALAARRAGYDRVWVSGREDAGAILEGTGAAVLPPGGTPPPMPPGRIVLMPDDVVGSPRWLRLLRETRVPDERLCPVGPGAVVEVNRPEPLARAVADAASLPEALAAWGAVLPPGASPDVEPPMVLASKKDLPAAERRLLRELVKPEDGFLTRHISRKISLAVTRLLAKTAITPNAMTLFCTLLGLAAAWCFGSSVAPGQLAGGILFLLHSILDGCDGELARLKFKESRLGGTLDFWGDNIVHVAVFSAFAYSWSAAVDDGWPLRLGAPAVAGTIVAAAFVYFHAMRPRAIAGPLLTTVSPTHRSRLTELLDEASRRDFIYLVLVLSFFGKAYWFLALAAIGTPIFALSLLFVAAIGVRRPPVPAESGALQ
jgi:1L-myo-inositol 1-phosphate cytidylyltransferase / CDP-L-myo-inositol myo-inositolphosphotransferase